MKLYLITHPRTGIQFWDLRDGMGTVRLSRLLPGSFGESEMNLVDHRIPSDDNPIAVYFIDERYTGAIVPCVMFVGVEWWLRCGLEEPTWDAFMGSQRVLSTATGIELGLLPPL